MLKTEDIKKLVYAEKDRTVLLRRYFHSHPEISKKEFGTAEKIEEELHSFGLVTRRVGETGVYSEIHGKGPGMTIILRADIDALPVTEKHECEYGSLNEGAMHACGHDAHTAALLSAAKILSEHSDEFPGTVKLCFQQAEEVGYGARVFLKEGLITGDRTFGLHMASNIDVGKVSATAGPNNASVDFFRITISGRGAHVSTPEKGIDAAYIAASITIGAQALVTRMTDPTDSVIIGIGKIDAGKAYNVVAESAVLEGTIRTMYPEMRKRVRDNLEKLVVNTAEIYGAKASIEYEDYASPLVNPVDTSEEVAKVASLIVGRENVITDRPYSLGGDDFAEFIIAVPGTYAYVGSRNKEIPETCVAHHDSMFDIDENCLPISVFMHVCYALMFLNGEL